MSRSRFVTLPILTLLLAACSAPVPPGVDPAALAGPVQDGESGDVVVRFVDVAPEAGLDHPVICGAPTKPYLIDTNGTGAAVIDYDGDGRMDIYVVHGATVETW